MNIRPDTARATFDQIFTFNEHAYLQDKLHLILTDEEIKAVLLRTHPDHLFVRKLLLPPGNKSRVTVGHIRTKYNACKWGEVLPRCVSFRYNESGVRVERKWGNKELTPEQQAAQLAKYLVYRPTWAQTDALHPAKISYVRPLGAEEARRLARVQAMLNVLPITKQGPDKE